MIIKPAISFWRVLNRLCQKWQNFIWHYNKYICITLNLHICWCSGNVLNYSNWFQLFLSFLQLYTYLIIALNWHHNWQFSQTIKKPAAKRKAPAKPVPKTKKADSSSNRRKKMASKIKGNNAANSSGCNTKLFFLSRIKITCNPLASYQNCN